MKPWAALAALLLALAPLLAQAQFSYRLPAQQPAGSWGYTAKPGWTFKRFAVAAANPLAADAGSQVLAAGGTAVDAAVTVQAVLALVEPQSSGIGGGAFLMHFDGSAVTAYDGRETAPAAAGPSLFLRSDGQPMSMREAVVGGRSVGVPGVMAMLELVHKEHGKLPWAQLFEPAITLAEKGFRVTVRLNRQLDADRWLRDDPVARNFYYRPDGKAVAAGAMLRNPALAAVLRRIAREGASVLQKGAIAQAIVDKVRAHPTNPGLMEASDLAGYQARKRVPLCFDHVARGTTYEICGMPPPSSGAIAIAQILGLLSRLDADRLAPQQGLPGADWLHLYAEASRLAFADRAQYVADPDFVPPPAGTWTSLIEPRYLDSRASLVAPGGRSMGVAQPGQPAGVRTSWAPMAEQDEHGTSHFSIVDAQGHAVAMTTTVEDAFGSRLMVGVPGLAGGFALNNELTDFSLAPEDENKQPIANRVEGGKRPRSSMSPTLVFDKSSRKLVLVAGSMGGWSIIHSTARLIYGVLHWGLDPQRAVDLPVFGSYNGPTLLEAGLFPQATVQALRLRGADVREQTFTSGSHAIHITPMGLLGGADPRREGMVSGD